MCNVLDTYSWYCHKSHWNCESQISQERREALPSPFTGGWLHMCSFKKMHYSLTSCQLYFLVPLSFSVSWCVGQPVPLWTRYAQFLISCLSKVKLWKPFTLAHLLALSHMHVTYQFSLKTVCDSFGEARIFGGSARPTLISQCTDASKTKLITAKCRNRQQVGGLSLLRTRFKTPRNHRKTHFHQQQQKLHLPLNNSSLDFQFLDAWVSLCHYEHVMPSFW